MASSQVNAGEQWTQGADWSRLIPGGDPTFDRRKKPVGSVELFTSQKVAEIPSVDEASAPLSVWTFLVPMPLQSRTACRWVRSVIADFTIVTGNWLLLGALRAWLPTFFPRLSFLGDSTHPSVPVLGIALIHAALITLMAYTEGLSSAADYGAQARILAKSVLWGTALLSCAYGLQDLSWVTSGMFCGAGVLHFSTLAGWRWKVTSRHGSEHESLDVRRVLIVGAGSVGRRLAAYIESHPQDGRTVCGFLDNDRPMDEEVIGRVSDLARLARVEFADEVLLAAPCDRNLTLQVLREAKRLRIDVEIVPELFGCKVTGEKVERVGDLPVICLHAERLPALSLAFKRLVDFLGAAFVLVLVSPLLAVIAGWIKLDSPGPVLYCAPRAGRKGMRFRCYKFRTMVSNADALKDRLRENNQRSGPFFKIAGDPRITRVGRLLRRYSLDELPQIWNVLKGDMSLVGPRPHPLDDVASYEIEHLARLDVTPGITGLWQVSARRDPSFRRGMELDREYIRTWSLLSDLRILMRTVLAVARGSGE